MLLILFEPFKAYLQLGRKIGQSPCYIRPHLLFWSMRLVQYSTSVSGVLYMYTPPLICLKGICKKCYVKHSFFWAFIHSTVGATRGFYLYSHSWHWSVWNLLVLKVNDSRVREFTALLINLFLACTFNSWRVRDWSMPPQHYVA